MSPSVAVAVAVADLLLNLKGTGGREGSESLDDGVGERRRKRWRFS